MGSPELTENEWRLTRELLLVRMELYKSQAQALQLLHNNAEAELKALGESFQVENQSPNE